jgi:hypothetical protein
MTDRGPIDRKIWLPGDDPPPIPRGERRFEGPCYNSGHTGSGTMIPDYDLTLPDGTVERRCGVCDEVLKITPPPETP